MLIYINKSHFILCQLIPQARLTMGVPAHDAVPVDILYAAIWTVWPKEVSRL